MLEKDSLNASPSLFSLISRLWFSTVAVILFGLNLWGKAGFTKFQIFENLLLDANLSCYSSLFWDFLDKETQRFLLFYSIWEFCLIFSVYWFWDLDINMIAFLKSLIKIKNFEWLSRRNFDFIGACLFRVFITRFSKCHDIRLFKFF